MASMYCVPSRTAFNGAAPSCSLQLGAAPSRTAFYGAAPSCSLQLGSSSSSSAVRPLPLKLSLPLLCASSSFFGGNSSYVLQPRNFSRAMRRSQPGMVNMIKAAFIFEWLRNIFRFFTRTPVKLFAQKLEADLDRAAKMVKTGASIVVEIAKEADEFAEEVERIAERTEEIAEKVVKATDTIEERIDEVLDVIEGEKKVVITSFKLVDSESELAMKSTTIAKEGNQTTVSIETSVVNENTLDKSNTS